MFPKSTLIFLDDNNKGISDLNYVKPWPPSPSKEVEWTFWEATWWRNWNLYNPHWLHNGEYQNITDEFWDNHMRSYFKKLRSHCRYRAFQLWRYKSRLYHSQRANYEETCARELSVRRQGCAPESERGTDYWYSRTWAIKLPWSERHIYAGFRDTYWIR